MSQFTEILKRFPHVVFNEQNEDSLILKQMSKNLLSQIKIFQQDYDFQNHFDLFDDECKIRISNDFSEYFFQQFPNTENYITQIYHAILARLVEFSIKKRNQKNTPQNNTKKIQFKFFTCYQLFKLLKVHFISDEFLQMLSIDFQDFDQYTEEHFETKECICVTDLKGNIVLADDKFSDVFEQDSYMKKNFFKLMSVNSQDGLKEKYGRIQLFDDNLQENQAFTIDYSIFSEKKLLKRIKRINFLNNNPQFKNYLKHHNTIKQDYLQEFTQDQLNYLQCYKMLQTQAFLSSCKFQNNLRQVDFPVIILITYPINHHEIDEHYMLQDEEISEKIQKNEQALQKMNEKLNNLF